MEELEYEARQKEAEEETCDSKKYASTELSSSPSHHLPSKKNI